MSYIYRWFDKQHESHPVEDFDDKLIRVVCAGRVLEIEVGVGARRRYIEFRVLDLWQMSIMRGGVVLTMLDAKVEKLIERKFIYLDDRADGDALVPAVDAILAATAAIELLDSAYYALLFKLREEVAEHFPEWIAFIRKALAAQAESAP